MNNYIFMISVLVILVLAMLVVTFSNFKLTNEQYDRLKGMVLRWSYLLTLLGVIVATFRVPYGEETITIVAAIGAFVAHCLGVSNTNYIDGAIETEESWVEDGEEDE